MTRIVLLIGTVFISFAVHAESWWAYVSRSTPQARQNCRIYVNADSLYAALIGAGIPEAVAQAKFPKINWPSDAALVAHRIPGDAGLPLDNFVEYESAGPVLHFHRSPDATAVVLVLAIPRKGAGSTGRCSTKSDAPVANIQEALFTGTETFTSGGGKYDTGGWKQTDSPTTTYSKTAQMKPAVGVREKECKNYSELAVRAYKTSMERACGFGRDSRWNNLEDRHYQWCMSVSNEKAQVETNIRTKMLQNDCKK